MLRQLNATEADAQIYGRLASSDPLRQPRSARPSQRDRRNRAANPASGATEFPAICPIVLLRIGDRADRTGSPDRSGPRLLAHQDWPSTSSSGTKTNPVTARRCRTQIIGLIISGSEAKLLDKPGGIFIRRLEQIAEEDRVLMQSVARVDHQRHGRHPRRAGRSPPAARSYQCPASAPRGRAADSPTAVEMPTHDLARFNGLGGFTPDGREYVITTSADSPTPAPWVNVLANPWFGTVVTRKRRRIHLVRKRPRIRLTPWNNDPVSDASGEAFYIRDEDSGQFWSPTPLPARGAMPYTIRHGFGYSVFEHAEDGISTEMRVYVATDAPVKFVVFKVRNISGRPRRSVGHRLL